MNPMDHWGQPIREEQWRIELPTLGPNSQWWRNSICISSVKITEEKNDNRNTLSMKLRVSWPGPIKIASDSCACMEVAWQHAIQIIFQLEHMLRENPFATCNLGFANDTCLNYIPFGLLQPVLRGTALGKDLKTLGQKCCNQTADQSFSQREIKSFVTSASSVTSWFLGTIPSASFDL